MPLEARTGDGAIYYETAGSGPPLLLLHPGLCDGSLWRTLGYVEALQDRFRLLIPDLRGHGRSHSPHDEAGYAADAMREDIGAVLDAEGLTSAHCWGFSLGALLALRFAAVHPARLRSLIAGAAVGNLPDTGIGTRTAALLERTGLESVAPPPAGDPAVLPLRPVILGQDVQAHTARYRAQAAWPLPDGLEAISLPLLLYVGGLDSFAGPVRDLAASLPGSEFVVVPGMGHMQAWSHPETIVPRAIEFLRRAEMAGRLEESERAEDDASRRRGTFRERSPIPAADDS
jgi:pimeloyl-ACP methyl ester carboxylesterase